MSKSIRKCGRYFDGKLDWENYRNKNGNLHREDGPALIWYFVNGNIDIQEYWINGKLHKIDGPAKISYSYNNDRIKDKEYWLNGKEIFVFSDEEFKQYIKCLIIK